MASKLFVRTIPKLGRLCFILLDNASTPRDCSGSSSTTLRLQVLYRVSCSVNRIYDLAALFQDALPQFGAPQYEAGIDRTAFPLLETVKLKFHGLADRVGERQWMMLYVSV